MSKKSAVKDTSKTFDVSMLCKKCGSNSWRVESKKLRSRSKEDLIVGMTMCHRGFGYDLGQFEHVCAGCGATGFRMDIKERVIKERASK